MFRPAFQTTLTFGCLLTPALLLAWFHFTSFPSLVAGTHHLWGTQKPLPTGFELLCRFGFVAYLPLLLIVVVAALSCRLPILRDRLCLAFCAGFLATVCVFYAVLLSTPALAHGLSLAQRGLTTRSMERAMAVGVSPYSTSVLALARR